MKSRLFVIIFVLTCFGLIRVELTQSKTIPHELTIIVTKNKFDNAGRLLNISHTGDNKTYADYYNAENRISQTDKDNKTTKYAWDHRNRLTKVETPTETIEYIYDHQNRLVKRTQDKNITHFVHDDWQIILQFDNKEPKPTNRYLWGTKQDELICNNNNWTLNDHLNTIRDIVKSDGNVESHLEYNAFGKLISETKNDQLLFAYTGKLFDKSSDLQWNINRWYNSNAGRWVSEDPIKFQSGDKNLYRFLLNMPLWAVDFYGYKPKVTVLPSQECILCNCDCPACCGTVDDLPPLQPKDNPTGLCCKNKQKLYKKFFNGSEAECMRHFSSTTFTNRNINLNVVITSVVVFYSYPFISGVASIGWTLAVYENERYAEILCNTHICDNIIQPYWKFDDDFCEWITACPDNYSYISQLPEIPKSVVEQGVDALFDTLKETNEFLEKSNNVTPGGPWGHPPRY